VVISKPNILVIFFYKSLTNLEINIEVTNRLVTKIISMFYKF